ncbi:MAG: polysaccharide biosynthesis protein, partial [Rhodobacteraceae bacterium]|nr:polysaccharide biosynthesis protein [Paracoccaceae bacterium]
SEGDIEIRLIGLRPGEKIEEELTLNNELIGTRYPKIFCAREDSLSEIEVASVLHGLRSALSASDDGAALKVVRHWVEGYQSSGIDNRLPQGQAV